MDLFCSGCRRWKNERLIALKKTVVLKRGKSIQYWCSTCAETVNKRADKYKIKDSA
jgi:hypothetical protein